MVQDQRRLGQPHLEKDRQLQARPQQAMWVNEVEQVYKIQYVKLGDLFPNFSLQFCVQPLAEPKVRVLQVSMARLVAIMLLREAQ